MTRGAEDMKLGLEREITELSKTIRLMKNEARKLTVSKHALRHNKKLRRRKGLLKQKRIDLFSEQDRIEEQKDQLTDNLENLLALSTERQNLFTLMWRII